MRLDRNDDGALDLAEVTREKHGPALKLGELVFHRFDANTDGRLDADEFQRTPDARSIELLTTVDRNADGKLSRHEFVGDRPAHEAELVVSYFPHLDADGDGWLRADEFPVPSHPAAARRVGSHDPEAAFRRLDSDSDGQVNRDEFRRRQVADDPGAGDRFRAWLERADGIFGSLDADGDAALSPVEFTPKEIDSNWVIADGEVLQPVPGTVFSEWEFHWRDVDRDGAVTLDEYRRRTGGAWLQSAEQDFARCDHDGSGRITFEEFKGMPGAVKDIGAIFSRRDRDGDGQLDLAEYRTENSLRPEYARRIFAAFDADGDGALSAAEFRETPEAHPIGLPPWRLRDDDNNGELSSEEYLKGLHQAARLVAEAQFSRFDGDQDGVLTWDEFPYPVGPDSYPTPPVFAHLDADGDQRLSFAELFSGLDPVKHAGQPRLRRAQQQFERLDQDGDGLLTWAEYRRNVGQELVASAPLPRTTPVDPALLFRQLDLDKDGRLNFDEYVARAASAESRGQEQRIFARFDRDGDAHLGPEEFEATPPANPDAEALFFRRDRDRDLALQLNEFIGDRTPDATLLERVFRRFDRDRDGALSWEEFRATPDAKPSADVLLATRDVNGDGRLNLNEFSDLADGSPAESARSRFAESDLNRDGFLSLAELKSNEIDRRPAPVAPANVAPPPAAPAPEGRSSSRSLTISLAVILGAAFVVLSYQLGRWTAPRTLPRRRTTGA